MLGYHLIGTISCENSEFLTNPEKLAQVSKEACEKSRLTVVGENYHLFQNPKAITYCFILSQSHFIVHTWPEENKIVFDIFTCSKEKDAEESVQVLAKKVNGEILAVKRVQV